MPLDGQTFVLPDLEFDEGVRQVLRNAADCIERRGWFRCGEKPYHESASSSCAMVAIRDAADWDIEETHAAAALFAKYLGSNKRGTDAWFVGVYWNNNPDRTKAQVVVALRQAAEL